MTIRWLSTPGSMAWWGGGYPFRPLFTLHMACSCCRLEPKDEARAPGLINPF
ncbi:hypothetical protein LZ31DRAFT_232587 [Colletotrichum somersetense]|nr:hypothetical protein LZ31DRAFT_232587 [Colletotrichum somersetense]